jgi:urease accessory protein
MGYFSHNTAQRGNILCVAIAALLFPALACAHVGVGATHGFLHGLAHPFSGLDHVCAMLAVGLWAAQMGGRALWRVPLTFVSVMALGGLLGLANIPVPYVEGGIIISLVALGALLAFAVRLPWLFSAALVGVFAVFHGYAHGAEMPQDASGLEYAAGFVLATALLHACGMAAALLAKKYGRAEWLRVGGAAILMCGGGIWLAG